MNYSDSERIETYLNNLGHKKVQDEPKADLVIFNSCSVKQRAEDKVIGALEKLIIRKQKNPNLLTALTGCMVRKSSTKANEKEDRDHFIKILKHLDIAFRIEDLPRLGKLIQEAQKYRGISTTVSTHSTFPTKTTAPLSTSTKIPKEELESYFHISPAHSSTSQVCIPVSTGCDKFCTYCIVPYARGREVSRDPDQILKEATEAVENGAIEITLLGQTVDSYGLSNIDHKNKLFDYDKIDAGTQDPPFVQLLQSLDKLHSKGLRRLRFTSPHPKDVSPELIASYATLKTLMPHIHLPIQSGDNNVLKRMNRPYTVERYREIVTALRETKPDIAITTDMIIGFCGETEEEFQNSCDLYEELDFDFCYSSQYSNRKGTYADKNLPDDIPQKNKSERWHRFNELIMTNAQKKYEDLVGQEVEVFVDEAVQPEVRTEQSYALIPTNKTFQPTESSDSTPTIYRGQTPHAKVIQFSVSESKNSKSLLGTLQKVLITKTGKCVALGELV